jgi:hypothetical protein
MLLNQSFLRVGFHCRVKLGIIREVEDRQLPHCVLGTRFFRHKQSVFAITDFQPARRNNIP